MKRFLIMVLVLFVAALLSGCKVRTYQVVKDRVDQEISGNRGYIQGNIPPMEEKERKTSRTINVLEIELTPPLKFEKK